MLSRRAVFGGLLTALTRRKARPVGGFNNPIIGGQGGLVYPSIHSPNFVHNSAGWTVNKDGSAEFNNVVIRNGSVISGTQLYYSGVPAHGNLVASISAAAGVDGFTNNYVAGFATYNVGTPGLVQIFDNIINFMLSATDNPANAAFLFAVPDQIALVSGVNGGTSAACIAAYDNSANNSGIEGVVVGRYTPGSMSFPTPVQGSLFEVQGTLGLAEHGSAPATPPSGGIIYVDGTGHLRYKGPSGTDTLLANP